MGAGLSVFNRAMLIAIDNVDHTSLPRFRSMKHDEVNPNVRIYRIPDMVLRKSSEKLHLIISAKYGLSSHTCNNNWQLFSSPLSIDLMSLKIVLLSLVKLTSSVFFFALLYFTSK